MKIMIESDQSITELHIKFADGSAKVDVKSDEQVNDYKSNTIKKSVESVVDNQKITKSSRKETTIKTAPVVDIPDITGREVKVDEGMNENF